MRKSLYLSSHTQKNILYQSQPSHTSPSSNPTLELDNCPSVHQTILLLWWDVRLGEQSVITNIDQYKCYRQGLTWLIWNRRGLDTETDKAVHDWRLGSSQTHWISDLLGRFMEFLSTNLPNPWDWIFCSRKVAYLQIKPSLSRDILFVCLKT